MIFDVFLSDCQSVVYNVHVQSIQRHPLDASPGGCSLCGPQKSELVKGALSPTCRLTKEPSSAGGRAPGESGRSWAPPLSREETYFGNQPSDGAIQSLTARSDWLSARNVRTTVPTASQPANGVVKV